MSHSYSWMPGWLRKFLNLDDEMPGYGPSTYSAEREYSTPPPQRPTVTYTPPAPTYTPSAPAPSYRPVTQGAPVAETTPRFASSYSPPPPPTPVAPARPAAPVSPGGNVPSTPTEGYVQPIGYAVRSYARGALPPQGLEQFTREFRATLTDVWNFYSYWTRFQTDELARMGKEAADAVLDNLPASPGEPAATTSVRRIKVTVGNGEKKAEQAPAMGGSEPTIMVTNIEPPAPPTPPVTATSEPPAPPVPTPAAPPTPPAPTAVFSPEVTADDAEVPPEGRRDVDVPAPAQPAADAPPIAEVPPADEPGKGSKSA